MWLNPQFPADLVTFTEKILQGKLHFLYIRRRLRICWLLLKKLLTKNFFLKKFSHKPILQTPFVIFKPLIYCFGKTIGFDVKASLATRPVSRLIRWILQTGDITKKFWEKAIQFHGTFHGLKITNWSEDNMKLIMSTEITHFENLTIRK